MILILSGRFFTSPVYKGKRDDIEGVIHAKNIISYLVDNNKIKLRALFRKSLFLPESASLKRVLLDMRKTENHLVFIVERISKNHISLLRVIMELAEEGKKNENHSNE